MTEYVLQCENVVVIAVVDEGPEICQPRNTISTIQKDKNART